ncbi:hypothetical protein PRZ48_007494 [Zasmidium cellare]|uniref:Heterokaryon incompatibility domain-containing protein n=1 Tax=Zasmidium cellare TaxID=395010 RepID=A0ABR0EKA2_ZASCE|nr:hypothetical protein PRZ48_007494 [Zasmidium cellare]
MAQLVNQEMALSMILYLTLVPFLILDSMSIFRLIDLHQMCIVQLHDCHVRYLKFAVLSYVWGTVKVVKLTRGNLDALQQPRSFEKISLPRTISDSIYFARDLGLQYLWVDALCILQDSDGDKAYQISNMGNVYSSAFVTIIAASGRDANAGLPGVSIDREGEQQEVIVIPPSNEDPGLSVLNTLKSYPLYYDEYYLRGKESVDLSKWSQRAWTLQESALSSRKITFTAQQVFWTCHQGYYCEESRFEIPGFYVKHWLPSIHKVTFQELANNSREPWDWYGHLVSEDYSRRDLSYDGDFGSAFDAIIKNMERYTGTRFHWGMPRSHFELAVMWNGFHAVDRRTSLTTLPMTNLQKQYIDARKFTVTDLQTHLPLLTPEQLSLIPDEHVLFFWATTTTFTVDYHQTKEGVTFQEYADWAWPAVQDDSGQTVGKMNRLASNTSQNKRRVELIELGRRGDPEVPPEIMPQMVLVLEICRDELGIASRVNYGEIEVEAWEASGPEACLVALA